MPAVIDSISSLLAAVHNEKQKYPRRELFFRGHSEEYSTIAPSIYRKHHIIREDIYFKEYILRNPNEFQGDITTFEKLVRMQHYKLPTRLLDITSNPLIALYFSLENKPNRTGELVVFAVDKQHIKYYDSDAVSVVSNVSRRPVAGLDVSSLIQQASESDDDFIERFNSNNDIQYLLHEIKQEKPYFKNKILKRHLESIFCVKPLLSNRRIIKQDGAFLLFGIKGSKCHAADFDAHIRVEKYQVIKTKNLREDLSLLGITMDKVYPELDTTAEYLKNLRRL